MFTSNYITTSKKNKQKLHIAFIMIYISYFIFFISFSLFNLPYWPFTIYPFSLQLLLLLKFSLFNSPYWLFTIYHFPLPLLIYNFTNFFCNFNFPSPFLYFITKLLIDQNTTLIKDTSIFLRLDYWYFFIQSYLAWTVY